MERGCSAPIPGVRVSSSFDQRPGRERPERGRREVERRISDIQLVRDFLHETLVGDARLRDLGHRSYEPHRIGFVGDDSSEELDKGRRSLRHSHEGHQGHTECSLTSKRPALAARAVRDRHA
jgi:hypothetical protein